MEMLAQPFYSLSPELVIGFGALFMLLVGAWSKQDNVVTPFVIKIGLGIMIIAGMLLMWNWSFTGDLLQGSWTSNKFIVFIKMILLVSTFGIFIMLHSERVRLSWMRSEVPVLMLLSLFGMYVMVSANDFLTLYMGMELQSLSLYALAAINRDNVVSSEAGVKYFVLGALASGLFLLGVSFIYGFTGTINFAALDTLFSHSPILSPALLVGFVLVLIALSFKVSAAPFHMWAPDVYQGAPTIITAFFASVPKVAALAIFLRLLVGPFFDVIGSWQQIIMVISVISMVWGAVGALRQTNIKRLMAYSSIGHVGYVLIALTAANPAAVHAMLVYMLIYAVMTVGTFGLIMVMARNGKSVENIDDLRGFSKDHPILAGAFLILMLSMAGIPPLAGFFAKFYVFLAAVQEGFFVLAVIGVITSVIAAFYYLRIIKVMYFDEPKATLDAVSHSGLVYVIGVTTAATLFFFVFASPVLMVAHTAARVLIGQ